MTDNDITYIVIKKFNPGGGFKLVPKGTFMQRGNSYCYFLNDDKDYSEIMSSRLVPDENIMEYTKYKEMIRNEKIDNILK